MVKARRHEQERSCSDSYVYRVSGEEKEGGNDLAGPKSGGTGRCEQEETASGARVLSLPGPSMLKHGKKEAKGSWGFRIEGFPISFGNGFFDRGGRE